ncbi:zinc finger protein 639-like [Haliotis rubra]|uniref:zinc finger protein 639-like n=1 Tax=Haliotis rubra TaxID=36100 RepID=UPI001EE5DAD2|nr:zinc finger protein 639-like [Haliotis rubra]XP_046551503.1 zinc finger protein 639-like [Haliotis rubra]
MEKDTDLNVFGADYYITDQSQDRYAMPTSSKPSSNKCTKMSMKEPINSTKHSKVLIQQSTGYPLSVTMPSVKDKPQSPKMSTVTIKQPVGNLLILNTSGQMTAFGKSVLLGSSAQGTTLQMTSHLPQSSFSGSLLKSKSQQPTISEVPGPTVPITAQTSVQPTITRTVPGMSCDKVQIEASKRQADVHNMYCDDQYPFTSSYYGKVPYTLDIASQLASAVSKDEITNIFQSYLKSRRLTDSSSDHHTTDSRFNFSADDQKKTDMAPQGTSGSNSWRTPSQGLSEEQAGITEKMPNVSQETCSEISLTCSESALNMDSEEEDSPGIRVTFSEDLVRKFTDTDSQPAIGIPVTDTIDAVDGGIILGQDTEDMQTRPQSPTFEKTPKEVKEKPAKKEIETSSSFRIGAMEFNTETLYSLIIEEKSETEYLCKNCKEVLPDKERAVMHMDVHHPYRCSVCSRTFGTIGDFREHRKTAHGEVLYCTRCTFSTPLISKLQRHVKAVHNPYESSASKFDNCVCHICGMTFTVWDSAGNHMEEVHGITHIAREGDLRCPICNYLSGSKTSFRNHMKKHAGLYIHCKFEGCKYKSVLSRLVDLHYDRVHLGKRSFPCPFEGCNVRSKKKTELDIHMNISHYKIRKYKCEQCGKGFMAKKHLYVHLRIHSDSKPVQCNFCDYRCRQKSSLNWHMKKRHPDMVEEKEKATYNAVPGIPAFRHLMKPGRKGRKKKKKKQESDSEDHDELDEVDEQDEHDERNSSHSSLVDQDNVPCSSTTGISDSGQ